MMLDLEFNIVVVERVKEYFKIEIEVFWVVEGSCFFKGWFLCGEVEFWNYFVCYWLGLDLVLRDLSLYVYGGEKVGIVGCIGVGKFFMIFCLF